jgi:hypothetical protein
MPKFLRHSHPNEDVRMLFMCPGCKCGHSVKVQGEGAWDFNDDVERPTISPSYLTWWREGEERVEKRCHSFIRDGQIQFLHDCSHELAGQTVELPEID